MFVSVYEFVCVCACVLEFVTDFNTNCLYSIKFEMFTMVYAGFHVRDSGNKLVSLFKT